MASLMSLASPSDSPLRSPSRSPVQPIHSTSARLRTRRSMQQSTTDAGLRSALACSDGPVASTSTLPQTNNTATKSRTRAVSAQSPAQNENNEIPAQPDRPRLTRLGSSRGKVELKMPSGPRSQPSTSQLPPSAPSLNLTQQNFDLSSWSSKLPAVTAAKASFQPGAAPSPGPGRAPPPLRQTRGRRSSVSKKSGEYSLPKISALPPLSHPESDEILTPTTECSTASRRLSSFPGQLDLTLGQNQPPVSPAETRRRKSDEMETAERDDYTDAPPAPAVRHGHARTSSLAHAHSLRPSRVLSQQSSANGFTFPAAPASGSLDPAAYSASHSLTRAHAPVSFNHPFNAESPAPSTWSHSANGPPSKRMSVEGLGSLAGSISEGDEDSDESANEGAEDDSVFGLGGTIHPNRRMRGHSFTRPTPPLFGGLPMPSSTSHPSHDSTRAARTRSRSRTAHLSNSSNGLDTLAEGGPPIDTFSPGSVRERGTSEIQMASPSWDVNTPPRRRSDGPQPPIKFQLPPTPAFNLFGSTLPSTNSTAFRRPKSSTVGEDGFLRASGSGPFDEERRGASMPDMSMALDSPIKKSSSANQLEDGTFLPRLRPLQTRIDTSIANATGSGFPSRRVASLDSLQPPELAPTTGRKRSATGALLTPALGSIRQGQPSPALWSARGRHESADLLTDEDADEDDAMDADLTHSSWGPPALTDGTTSASSSLSTALSSHADEERGVSGSSSNKSINNSTAANPAGEPFYTPQNYKNVKPLQAVFMSTGLVSKRGSAVANRRDSGIGLGFTPAAGNLYEQLRAQQDETKAANLATLAAEGVQTEDGPAEPRLVLKNPLLAAVARNSVMPDTPVKRTFSTGTGATSALGLAPAILADEDDEEDEEDLSQRTVPGSASSSNTATSVGQVSPASLTVDPSASSRSAGSPSSIGGVSPTAHATRSSAARNLTVGASGRPAKGRQLFRRRSSGQVEFGLSRSGGSSAGASFTSGEVEPMTPTRSVGGRWWDAPQLVGTPHAQDETPPITPAMPAFPDQSNLPLVTPHGQGRASLPLSIFDRAVRFAPSANRPPIKSRQSSGGNVPQIPQPGWFENNFVVVQVLGDGAFSDAFEVRDRQREERVFAVKRTKQPFAGPKDRVRRLEEVDILRYFSQPENRSPHLIELVDAWEQMDHLFIQTELCANGNLSDFLMAHGQEHDMLDETRLWKILTETASGLAHLHARNVLHLDIKPANIFIDGAGHLKLGDFGLATRWPRTDPLAVLRGAAVNSPGGQFEGGEWRTENGERRVRAKSNGDAPEDLEREGDREYIAPEILRGQYGKEADMFSLGLVLIEAAANVVLPDNGDPWRKLRNNDFSDVAVPLGRLSPTLVMLITSLCSKLPEQRSSVGQVMHHPVVAKLFQLLRTGLELEAAHKEGKRLEQVPPVLGAVRSEAESFLDDLFNGIERDGMAHGAGAEVLGMESVYEDAMEMD